MSPKSIDQERLGESLAGARQGWKYMELCQNSRNQEKFKWTKILILINIWDASYMGSNLMVSLSTGLQIKRSEVNASGNSTTDKLYGYTYNVGVYLLK